MLTESQIVMIDDMPFVLTPLEKATFTERDVIYAIFSLEEDGRAFIIDVGQSPETGAGRMNTPERLERWQRTARGQILVGTHRPATDFNMAEDRLKIIEDLRRNYHAPFRID